MEETAAVCFPGRIRTIYMGVLTFPWMHRITQAPDGTLWGVIYCKRLLDGQIAQYYEAIFLRSEDGGRCWEVRSSIPYQPDAMLDPHAEERDGFTEPNIAFLPDGGMLCLLRTTDANTTGPMVVCHSDDGAQSWSTPEPFDDCGVWPALLTLENGVTLAAYGRPGLYLRGTRDRTGRQWADRDTVVAPLASQQDTCSYSDLIALSENDALLAYSDFNHPDKAGRPCKTILVRRISVG